MQVCEEGKSWGSLIGRGLVRQSENVAQNFQLQGGTSTFASRLAGGEPLGARVGVFPRRLLPIAMPGPRLPDGAGLLAPGMGG